MSRYGELDLGDLGPGPSVDDWWDERRHRDPALYALALDDAPLRGLVEPDPREDWGTLDAGGRVGGGQAGGAETEVVRARVARLSPASGGVQLVGWPPEAPGAWLNVSRFAAGGVTLAGLGVGDEVELTVERGRNGRYYITAPPALLQKRPAPGAGEG
jgi:hypothetical protein